MAHYTIIAASLIIINSAEFGDTCSVDADCTSSAPSVLAATKCATLLQGSPNMACTLPCTTASDCAIIGLACIDLSCGYCATDADCGAGNTCSSLQCQFACSVDSDCVEILGEICDENSICGYPPEANVTACSTQGDCGANEICENSECVHDGSCTVSSDCTAPGPNICSNGECRIDLSCQSNADCQSIPGYIECAAFMEGMDKTCTLSCTTVADCFGSGYGCRDSACVGCTSDADCGTGNTCSSPICKFSCNDDADCCTSCGQICDDNNSCAYPQLVPTSCTTHTDCNGVDEICQNSECIVGSTCTTPSDCTAPETCINGVCDVDFTCQSNADCQAIAYADTCSSLGWCYAACSNDACQIGELASWGFICGNGVGMLGCDDCKMCTHPAVIIDGCTADGDCGALADFGDPMHAKCDTDGDCYYECETNADCSADIDGPFCYDNPVKQYKQCVVGKVVTQIMATPSTSPTQTTETSSSLPTQTKTTGPITPEGTYSVAAEHELIMAVVVIFSVFSWM